QDFDQAEIGEVAVECGGRPFSRLLDRVGRKLHRDAAGLANALAHAVRKFEVVTVAGRQVVSGLGNADDRLARLQFPAGQAVIEIALQIERGHARIGRVVEPFAGAELAGFSGSCGIMPVGLGFFHWLSPGVKTRNGLSEALMSTLRKSPRMTN